MSWGSLVNRERVKIRAVYPSRPSSSPPTSRQPARTAAGQVHHRTVLGVVDAEIAIRRPERHRAVADDSQCAGCQMNGRFVPECLGQDDLHSIDKLERLCNGRRIVQCSLGPQAGMEGGFLQLATAAASAFAVLIFDDVPPCV